MRHHSAVNRYMFIEVASGGTNRYPGHNRSHADEHENVLAYHKWLGSECREILCAKSPTDFNSKRTTPEGASISVEMAQGYGRTRGSASQSVVLDACGLWR